MILHEQFDVLSNKQFLPTILYLQIVKLSMYSLTYAVLTFYCP